MQDALIISPLAAVNNIAQFKAKVQADEKLGFDGVERQRRLRRERVPAQGGHFQESVFEVIGSFRDRPAQGSLVKFIQLGNSMEHPNRGVDGYIAVKF